MPFVLTKADQDALENVDILINGDGTNVSATVLNSETLMFPPVVTKDSKTAKWLEFQSGGYEPFKYYVQSQSRQLGLQFEWVVGTFAGSNFTPLDLHRLLSEIKSYFYGAYFSGTRNEYPRVLIRQLYDIIPKSSNVVPSGNDGGQGGATFRLMNIDIKYSDEIIKVENRWYPMHVKLSMNLEGASKLQSTSEDAAQFRNINNLNNRPHVEWY